MYQVTAMPNLGFSIPLRFGQGVKQGYQNFVGLQGTITEDKATITFANNIACDITTTSGSLVQGCTSIGAQLIGAMSLTLVKQ